MPLQIYTAEPVENKDGKTLVFFRRKKVSADKAFRAVLVSPYNLPVAVMEKVLENGLPPELTNAEEVFQQAIVAAFMDSAGSILRRFCEEQPDAKEVSEDLFSFSAVVAEMQASEGGQRLNGDQIAEWYKDSKTLQDAKTRYNGDTKKEAALRAAYLSLASNNPGIPPNLATKMIAYLNPEDTEHPVCKALAKRLEKLTQVNVSADEL